jgi:glycosyltransferase involved in cell wall biosynthesis
MRILHVTPNYYPALGGSDFHIKEISERLAARGHEVMVLTLTYEDQPANAKSRATELINGVAVRRVPANVGAYKAFNRVLEVRGASRFLRALAGPGMVHLLSVTPLSLRAFLHALRASTDVMAVINWYHMGLAYQCCVASHVNRIPLVGFPLFHLERAWSHVDLYKRLLNGCDAVLANTEYEKQHIARRVPRHTGLSVGGVGVDPGIFETSDAMRIRARYCIGDAPVVGYLGRIAANKGVTRLIEAMRIVWATEPGAKLVLAGTGFPPNSTDRDIIRVFDSLCADEQRRVIRITGFDEQEKPSIFAAFDVFAMPSVAESFGIAYLEAWMCNKPVIGARIGSTQEVIRDNVDGLLVDPENPRDIAAAILTLLRDPAKRTAMATSGREKTLAQFTWDQVTHRVEEVYLGLAKKRASRTANSAGPQT